MEHEFEKMVEDMKQMEERKIKELESKQHQLMENLTNKEKTLNQVEETHKQLQEESMKKDKLISETKVDKSEVDKLNDELMKMKEGIIRSKIENEAKIKAQERSNELQQQA